METKLLEVHSIDLTLLKSNPPHLSIVVFGSAPTLGWTSVKLIPFVYIVPPEDGVYEFDLVGTPPSGISGQMITPAVAQYFMQNIPQNLKGVRIYASLNKLEKTFGSDIKTLDYPDSIGIDFVSDLRRTLEQIKPDGGIMESAYEYVDAVTDFVREHNIGGSIGRDIANDVDRATDRAERERR